MNIYQKLIEVRKSCQYLKKDNKGYQFQYVSSSQTLGTLRGAMDEQGLLLIPTINSYEVRLHTTKKGDTENYTLLDMTFTWVNAENPGEKVECRWTGQGLDNGEKGVGKALTYAEKYFLLKFFNIATDRDDPDSFQTKTENGNGSKHTEPAPVTGKTKHADPSPVVGEINKAESIKALQEVFAAAYHMRSGYTAEAWRAIEEAKDRKKGQLAA